MTNDSATPTRKSWTTIDKTDWPRGEWDLEPDKVQWVDEVTGLDCLIVRGPVGALCGYVGVPPEHSWHGIGYSDHLPVECAKNADPDDYCFSHSPEASMQVHGGLTYSDACQPSDDESRGICHVPEPGRPDDVWWFGFDCAHAWDIAPRYDHSFEPDSFYRSVSYVEREIADLARQLSEVGR